MGLQFNNNTPTGIMFNGNAVNSVNYNGNVVWNAVLPPGPQWDDGKILYQSNLHRYMSPWHTEENMPASWTDPTHPSLWVVDVWKLGQGATSHLISNAISTNVSRSPQGAYRFNGPNPGSSYLTAEQWYTSNLRQWTTSIWFKPDPTNFTHVTDNGYEGGLLTNSYFGNGNGSTSNHGTLIRVYAGETPDVAAYGWDSLWSRKTSTMQLTRYTTNCKHACPGYTGDNYTTYYLPSQDCDGTWDQWTTDGTWATFSKPWMNITVTRDNYILKTYINGVLTDGTTLGSDAADYELTTENNYVSSYYRSKVLTIGSWCYDYSNRSRVHLKQYSGDMGEIAHWRDVTFSDEEVMTQYTNRLGWYSIL